MNELIENYIKQRLKETNSYPRVLGNVQALLELAISGKESDRKMAVKILKRQKL